MIMLSDRVEAEGEGKGVIAQPHAHAARTSSSSSSLLRADRERERERAHAPLAERKLRDRGFPWDVIVDHDRWLIAALQGSNHQVRENWRIIADRRESLANLSKGERDSFCIVCNDGVERFTPPAPICTGSICTRQGAAFHPGNILELVRTSKNSCLFILAYFFFFSYIWWISYELEGIIYIFVTLLKREIVVKKIAGSIVSRYLSFFLFVASRRSFCNN